MFDLFPHGAVFGVQQKLFQHVIKPIKVNYRLIVKQEKISLCIHGYMRGIKVSA